MTKESTQRTALIEKIGTLPPEQQAEVENFVDFLASKQRRRAALGRLLSIAPALEAAEAPPANDDDIVAEVKKTRADRRPRKKS